MCYTIELYLSRKAIEERFSLDTSSLYDFDFRYFYSAFQNPYLPVVTQDAPDRVQLMQWGLIPGWTRDYRHAEKIRSATYNARSESIHEKASFRQSFKYRRCWVLGHGFFEWQEINSRKIPWYIRLKNDAPFVFAGLYDFWVDPDTGEQYSTFSVITTRANPMLERIHNTKKRMPVILHPNDENHWIDSSLQVVKARELMTPYPEDEMIFHPVSGNIVKKNSDPHDPGIIEPITYPVTGFLFK